MQDDKAPAAVSAAAFARLLNERFGLRMTRQAVWKAEYLPKDDFGRIVVQDALLMLAERGRIDLDASLPLNMPETASPGGQGDPAAGRPKLKTNSYYDELTLTEKVKRRKLEIELAEKEGKLLRAEDVAEAMVASGRRIGAVMDRLPTLAEQLVGVARTEGAQGVRELLRREARAMRQHLAEALTLAAAETGDDTEQDSEKIDR